MEVLVSLAVFSLMMAAIAEIFFSVLKDWRKQKMFAEAFNNNRLAFDFMSNELRFADGETPDAGTRCGIAAGKIVQFDLDRNTGAGTQHCFYWQGNGGAYGDAYTLYRGIGSDKFDCAGANGARQEMMNFLVDATFTVTRPVTANCTVSLNMTMRPRPDTAEGAGNRNYNLRTLVRAQN